MLALGTALVIGACFVSTFGVNLQKLAHLKNETLPPATRQPYAKLWTWQLGMLLMIAGSVMDLLALPFVPQSRVAVLGSVAMVANVVITPVFLKEQLTRFDVAGCAITVVGCSVATTFGAYQEVDLTPDCLMDSLVAPGFIVYFSLVLVYLLGLYLFIAWFEWNEENQKLQLEAGAPELGEEPGAGLALLAGLAEPISPKGWAFIYASFAGTAGAQSIMFAKGSLEMSWSAVKGLSSPWYMFVCLPPMAVCLYCQVHYLNQGLRLFDALFVVPVYQTFWIVMGILSGLIFYQEYRTMEPLSSWMFALGCCINLAGVVTLSQRQPSETESLDYIAPAASQNNLSTELLSSSSTDGEYKIPTARPAEPHDDYGYCSMDPQLQNQWANEKSLL